MAKITFDSALVGAWLHCIAPESPKHNRYFATTSKQLPTDFVVKFVDNIVE